MKIVIANRYKICNKLGQGSFGILYQGENIRTNELVAIKLEPIKCNEPFLFYEAQVYEKLKGLKGICNVHWTGV